MFWEQRVFWVGEALRKLGAAGEENFWICAAGEEKF